MFQQLSKWFLFIPILFILTFALGQEPYNSCGNALEICPSIPETVNNIGANATFCPNCEDDFQFCFTGENTIWLKFTTNSLGGDATLHFQNIVFENQPGQGNGLQAAIIHAQLPCISSSYELVSNCEANGVTNFNLLTPGLQANTTYYIVVNGTLGTTSNAEATLQVVVEGTGVDRNPSVSIQADKSLICTGNTVTITATTSACEDESMYDWYIHDEWIASTQEPEFIFADFNDQDLVKVKVTCSTYCPIEITSNAILIHVNDLLVDAGEDVTIERGGQVILNGQAAGGEILWMPDYNISDPTSLTPLVYPDETTTYFLMATDDDCVQTDEVTVFVKDTLIIPKAFSPNGDGVNDTWEILGIEYYPDCHIQVFSRWGQQVFETTGYPVDKRWEGTSKSGRPLKEAAYYYVIDLRHENFEKPLKGIVTIIR